MSAPDLTDLLRDRGVESATVVPLLGGEKNRSWLVEATDGRRFVARCYSGSTVAEVEYELHATEFLAQRSFPTPAPIRSRDRSLWHLIDGRPAALFEHATGEHLADLTDGYFSADLSRGRDAAALAAQMHVLSSDQAFPGRRTNRRDPLHQIATFLDSPYANVSALEEAVVRLVAQHEMMTGIYAEPDGLRQGLVHNDISAHNLLLDKTTGSITALLDFDDCITSFQLYDLGRIAETWGRDTARHADMSRIQELIAAYHATRPMTDRERELAVAMIATYAAATGVEVLTNMLRQGAQIQDPRDSHSMLFFLDICV
jgi:Ser/Thr protein kinase RdoA (MazF antagonist)